MKHRLRIVGRYARGVVAMLQLGAAPAPLSYIEAGDAEWDAGNRPAARAAWETAAASAHPAVVAMAEARLLQVSGNLGLLAHGPKLDTALARCPEKDAWCRLARVDAAFFSARIGIPVDLSVAYDTAIALPAELEPHRQRRLDWLTHAPPAASPGTWTLGLAPYGVTGLGFGLAATWNHPDVHLTGARVMASLGATSTGTVGGAIRWDGPGAQYLHADLSFAQTRVQQPGSQGVVTQQWRGGSSAIGPGWRCARSTWEVGARGNIDLRSVPQRALGIDSTATLRYGPWSTQVSPVGLLGDYRLFTQTIDQRLVHKKTGIAARWVATATQAHRAPQWRLPSFGAGSVLRQGPWQALRHPWLAGTVLEERVALPGPLSGVVFGEAAWGGRWVAGAGAGIRLALPPNPDAALRLDVAWGSLGWGISTGWGQAF